MQLKILTLNVWRYYEWEKRKEELLSFLEEQDADLVFLQEVAFDSERTFSDQVTEINEHLDYPACAFSKMMKMTHWHGKPLLKEMFFGLGFLCKFPLLKKEMVFLPACEKQKKFGFLYLKIVTPKGDLDVLNVHFENTDAGARQHLRQTLAWCAERGLTPIIAGDFNLSIVSDLIDLAGEDYHISYQLKPYFSFYPTNHSHDSEPVTLDYILVHKKKFLLKDVECVSSSVSDHNPVVAFSECI